MRIHSGLSPALQGQGGSALGAAQGQFRGEALRLQADTPGLNTDAMEEISLHLADKARDKRVDADQLQSKNELQLLQLEQIQAYLDAAHQQDQAPDLKALAQRLAQGQQAPGRELRQQEREPQQQYIALSLALQEPGLVPERREQLADLLAGLQADHGPALRAAFHSAAALGALATDAQDFAALQRGYTDLVLGRASLAQTLDAALSRFGAQDFSSGLAALVQALGADLAAQRSSAPPERLQALMQDLHQLGTVSTVLEAARQLDAELRRTHAHPGFDTVALVKDLVKLTAERFITAARFEPLAKAHGGGDPTAVVGLLTGVKALLRQLPPAVFADAESRNTQLAAIQTALDDAIAREEEALE